MLKTSKGENSFNAVRGIQAGREYYVIMCPLWQLLKVFAEENSERTSIKNRRVLSKSRYGVIEKYIKNNTGDYCFNSLAVSVDSDVNFVPISTKPEHYNIGTITIQSNRRVVINDGQHRIAALGAILKEKPELGNETISIVLFIDSGLHRSAQKFVDLNYYGVRPPASLKILLDQRDSVARLTSEVIETVPLLRMLTERESETISESSSKLFTLSTIYKSTKELISNIDHISFDEQLLVAIQYWHELIRQFPEWHSVMNGQRQAADVRRCFVHTFPTCILGLGIVGRSLLELDPTQWGNRLKCLRQIDWSIDADAWAGILPREGHPMSNRKPVLLIARYLKQAMDLPTTKEEKEAELVYAK